MRISSPFIQQMERVRYKVQHHFRQHHIRQAGNHFLLFWVSLMVNAPPWRHKVPSLDAVVALLWFTVEDLRRIRAGRRFDSGFISNRFCTCEVKEQPGGAAQSLIREGQLNGWCASETVWRVFRPLAVTSDEVVWISCPWVLTGNRKWGKTWKTETKEAGKV